MQKPIMFIRLALLTLVLLAVNSTSANAYSQYSTDGSTGNCATCHGDFRASPYLSLADGGSWNDDLHNVHRNDMLNGFCAACHGPGDKSPVLLDSSVGGSGLAPNSCLGCHGRSESAAGGQINGAGLRQHHWNNGIQTCGTTGCHTDDSNPAVFTTVGENVLPPYYATPGTGHPNIPTDPCNPGGGEDFAASAIGLDNDGDNAYDQSDTNCQAPTPDINLNPAVLNFGNVTTGSSAIQVSAIQNLGTANLNVTAITLCAGTSTEFTWPPITPFTLTPGAGQDLNVTYEPVGNGLDTGCLEISSDDPDEPTISLSLGGTGVPPMPDINLTPAILNFGNVPSGSSKVLNTTVQNLGTANLNVTTIALCAGTSTEFTWLPPAPFTTLTPGTSQNLDVIYTPVDTGLDTGCLDISSNDPDEATTKLMLNKSSSMLIFNPAYIRPKKTGTP